MPDDPAPPAVIQRKTEAHPRRHSPDGRGGDDDGVVDEAARPSYRGPMKEVHQSRRTMPPNR